MKFISFISHFKQGESLPAWGAWIEIFEGILSLKPCMSLPAWGAWIEIYDDTTLTNHELVAPRMGGVD